MIVLDASVLIAYLDGKDAHHQPAEALLAEVVDDDLGVNPLTLAEVLVAPARDGRLEETRSALDDLEVDEVPFPAETATRLALLRAGSGLKMPDCCVLLTALDEGATVASFDDRLTAAARERGLPTLGR